MQDSDIVELYWQRDESAIAETSRKYGNYCHKIAQNILACHEDSEECVNDAYLAAWNSIPPARPAALAAYLGRLTRNLAINRYKANNAAKRGGGELALSLDELDDCIPDPVAEERSAEELGRLISDFLHAQPATARQAFVRRYFYNDSISDVAQGFGLTVSAAKSMLHRTRLGLRSYLEEHGINIE